MKSKYMNLLKTAAFCGAILLPIGFLSGCKEEAPIHEEFSVDGIDSANGDYINISVGQAGKGVYKTNDGLIASDCYRYIVRTEANWKVIPKSADTSWITFMNDDGKGTSSFTFGIWANKGFDKREADFAIVLDGREQPGIFMHIEQAPTIPTFSVATGPYASVPSEGGEVAIQIDTNTGDTEYSIAYADPTDGDWLKFVTPAPDEKVTANNFRFSADKNMNEEEREAIVTFWSKVKPELKSEVKVVQNTFALIFFDGFDYISRTKTTDIWDSDGELEIGSWAGEAATSGWTGLKNGTQPAARVYGRRGYISLGGGNRIGTVASPALDIDSPTDINVSFDCVAYVTKTGIHDYNDLYVAIWGPGEFADATEDLTVNYPALGGSTQLKVLHKVVTNCPNLPEGIFPTGYNEWDSKNAKISLRVNGATSETRIILIGGYWENARSVPKYDNPDPVQNGISYRRNYQNNRLGIDNFKVVRIIK